MHILIQGLLQMETVLVVKNKDKLIIVNNSKEKIMIKKLIIHYPSSVYLGSGTGHIKVKDEKEMQKELMPDEKFEITLLFPEAEKVSVFYLVRGISFSQDFEL